MYCFSWTKASIPAPQLLSHSATELLSIFVTIDILMKREMIPLLLLSFVNTLNFSILIPILPFIIKAYGGGTVMYGVILSTYPFFQFFAAPILGSLSDRYGRRPILLISQAGTMLSWVIFEVSYFVPHISIGALSVPALVIILARIADGVTGGNNAVANAYLSDITTREEKTKAFGLVGGVVGLGFIVGPALGGLTMSSSLGYLAPILLTLGVSIVTLIVMMQYLPESLPPEKRVAHVKINLKDEFQFFSKLKEYSKNRQIKYLFFLRTMFLFVFSSFSSIFVLFMIDTFKFDASKIGMFFVLVGIFLIFNQAFLAGFISKKLGDLKTFIFGQLALVVSQFLYVFITNFWMFLPLAYLNNFGLSISMPTFKSLLSKSVDESQQGEIMGIDESFFSASSAISPLIATWIYATIGKYVFLVQAIVLLGSIAFFEMKKGWKSAI